jgi:hypothetical protein
VDKNYDARLEWRSWSPAAVGGDPSRNSPDAVPGLTMIDHAATGTGHVEFLLKAGGGPNDPAPVLEAHAPRQTV